MSNAVLDKLGIKHTTITGNQKSLYTKFAKSGRPLTWDAIRNIEVKSGLDLKTARNYVRDAIKDLKSQGVSGPTKIPWNK